MAIKLNILKKIQKYFVVGNCRQLTAIDDKKSNIGMQTIFFILMSIVMVWIIYFGLSKMFLVTDTISENERISYKLQLKIAFNYCEDPINSGSSKTIIINSNAFDSVCILGVDTQNPTYKYKGILEFKILYDSNVNVVLFKSNLIDTAGLGEKKLKNVNIVDSFKIPFEITQTACYFKNSSSKLKVTIPCS